MQKYRSCLCYLVLPGICLAVVCLLSACDYGLGTILIGLGNGTMLLSEVDNQTDNDTNNQTDNQTDNATGPRRPLMAALDADQDGQLSTAELDNATTALLALDANGDGVLTRDELRPARPEDADVDEENATPPPPPPGHGPEGFGPPCDPFLPTLDADRDGELSATELDNATAALNLLDADGDGTVTQDELRPAFPLPPLVAALDADADGELSAAELDHASAALRQLDTDGDGVLTIDELRPPKPEAADDDNTTRMPCPGPGPDHGRRHHGPQGDPLLPVLDADQDGQLSADELDNATAAVLTLDTDGDGSLTPDELRPSRPQDMEEDEATLPSPGPGPGCGRGRSAPHPFRS